MQRIDSHQHFWQLSRGDYTWLTKDLGNLYRDYLPHDIKKELEYAQVSDTVLIQATDTTAETEFLFANAYNHSFIAGVVGWVDMESPNALDQLSWLMQNPYFKGIRPMIQDIDDVDWLLKPELTPVFNFLAQNGLSFDALVLPKHLANLQVLINRHTQLNVVIDHGGKPNIKDALGKPLSESVNKQWAEDIAELAKHENVHCKLSGLVTEAGEKANYSDIERYMSHLYQCFGAKKLMWGSDWPVVNLTSDYSTWLDIADTFIKKLPIAEQNSIWADNTRSFYGL